MAGGHRMNRESGDVHGHSSGEASGSAPEPRRPSARAALILIAVILIAAVVAAIGGIVPRIRARAQLADQTNELAAPTVMVAKPIPGKPVDELTLPGNMYAYIDSPVYARTNGYLEKWYYDIGAHVKEGQLLAVISTPELDQQLLQARADLATAQANAGLAAINSARYRGLLTQNAVSALNKDTFVTQEASTSSAVKSAESNVQRLEALQSFERVYAPFDGVITARNIDIGQLINAGAASEAGTQLFHMESIDVLRVYVNVPQPYARGAVPGVKAELTLPEYPGQRFPGKIVRTARAIDPSSRTLLVEVDVDNRDGKLAPGALAEVHIPINAGYPTVVIPVPALIFRSQGLQVGAVVKGPKGDQAKLYNIHVSEDDGTTIQVISGLPADAEVIQNPPDSLIDGEAVQVVQPDQIRADGTGGAGSAGSGAR